MGTCLCQLRISAGKTHLAIILKINLQKNNVVSGKTLFNAIGPFCTPRSICLNISFWQGRFIWKCRAFNLSTLNFTPVFKRKVLVFQKTFFKVKVLKTCRSLKQRDISKILCKILKRDLRSFCWFLKKPLRGCVFLCKDKNHLTFFRKICWIKQPILLLIV